jgi:hypothetical protein
LIDLLAAALLQRVGPGGNSEMPGEAGAGFPSQGERDPTLRVFEPRGGRDRRPPRLESARWRCCSGSRLALERQNAEACSLARLKLFGSLRARLIAVTKLPSVAFQAVQQQSILVSFLLARHLSVRGLPESEKVQGPSPVTLYIPFVVAAMGPCRLSQLTS